MEAFNPNKVYWTGSRWSKTGNDAKEYHDRDGAVKDAEIHHGEVEKSTGPGEPPIWVVVSHSAGESLSRADKILSL